MGGEPETKRIFNERVFIITSNNNYWLLRGWVQTRGTVHSGERKTTIVKTTRVKTVFATEKGILMGHKRLGLRIS